MISISSKFLTDNFIIIMNEDEDEFNNLISNIITYGFICRKNNKDGIIAWNNIKCILERINVSFEWSNWASVLYEKLKKMGVKGEPSEIDSFSYEKWKLLLYENSKKIDAGEDIHKVIDFSFENWGKKHQEWEKQHFFVQLGRIPYVGISVGVGQNNSQFYRLGQIAFNMGQINYFLMQYPEDEIYTREWQSFYNLECMNIKKWIKFEDWYFYSDWNLTTEQKQKMNLIAEEIHKMTNCMYVK